MVKNNWQYLKRNGCYNGGFYIRMRMIMDLFRLVIVDDEPILLQGLLETYDWEEMGFLVVGTAQNGKQAIDVIRKLRPDVVLTDIRMKQITGLEVMEEIKKENKDCIFVVVSAYRDFEYAKQACELGAFAYLLKPIEDEKLSETMRGVYESCIMRHREVVKYETWKNLLIKDADSFLMVIVEKYVNNGISEDKMKEVFGILSDMIGDGEWFVTVCVDVDLSYKITNSLEYEMSRFAMFKFLEENIKKYFFCWSFEEKGEECIFIVKVKETSAVRQLKKILEYTKEKQESSIVAAISKPYSGIEGIKRSFDEAKKLFQYASASGASAFTIPEKIEETENKFYSEDVEQSVVAAVRKNDQKELKEAFVGFIYQLPKDEEAQGRYIHRIMLKVEFMVEGSYGMTEELRNKFKNFYSNINSLPASKIVDVCYKILIDAIEARDNSEDKYEAKYFKEYMEAAAAYIEKHLDEEGLSIVDVAASIYLNPVYFGRVFKKTFNMTFKKYLMQQRMEKAKRLLESGNESIGNICEQVGIGAPSYFSHLFKQYTGKLPSEYKKEYEA